MEPDEPSGSPTADDWAPWATPESPASQPGAAGDDAAAGGSAATDATGEIAPVAPRPVATSRRRTPLAPTGPAPKPTGSVSAGGLGVLVGAAVVVGSTFLNVVETSVGINKLRSITLSTTYFDTDNGKIVAAIAAVVFVVGLIFLVREGKHLIPAIATGIGGAAILALSISDRLDLDNIVGDQRSGLPRNQYRGLFDVTAGPGLYVCIGGGAIIVIGSILAALRR